MKRRDTFKALLVGGIAGATIPLQGCRTDIAEKAEEVIKPDSGYGRTPSEQAHDEKINAEIFLNDKELSTIATLCDIILPATPNAGSATEAKVPEFIDFIIKDIPHHQLPMRGGLMWLNGESTKRYNKSFVDCTKEEQIAIVDDIAYPDPENKNPDMAPGRAFFGRMRNLTMTGYYTSKMGIDDLGYVGNRANLWDGVPQEVLDKHGLSYPEEWMDKFVDHDTRDIVAEWDAAGNLIS